MPEDVTPDPTQATTQTAQLAAERMVAGEETTPQVDVAADYEASKAYSVSQIDRTGEGAKAAEAATSPQLKVPQAEEVHSEAKPTGNPDDYREMARDVNPRA